MTRASARAGSRAACCLSRPDATREHAPASGGAGVHLDIQADRFAADRVIVRIAEGDFTWPNADEKFVMRTGAQANIGLDLTNFAAANITLDGDDLTVRRMETKRGASFRLYTDLFDKELNDGSSSIITSYISNMPRDLRMTWTPNPLASGPMLSLTMRDDPVDTLIFTMQTPDAPSLDIEMNGIPPNKEIGFGDTFGAAILNSLTMTLPGGGEIPVGDLATLGGLRVTRFLDGSHFVSTEYGNTYAFDLQFDLDGSAAYPGSPEFMNMRTRSMGTTSVQAQWGQYSMSMRGNDLATVVTGGAMLVETVSVVLYNVVADCMQTAPARGVCVEWAVNAVNYADGQAAKAGQLLWLTRGNNYGQGWNLPTEMW